jgi:hypothetical protein
VVPDGECHKSSFAQRKRQCPVSGDECHTGFVMGHVRDAPADVMQKCSRCKQTPRLPAAIVDKREVIVDRKRQTADLICMTEILGEKGGRVMHDLQILFVQTTTRPFSW